MTSSAPRPERARVAVFAKAPVPGTVKTRLAQALGDDAAARVHTALVVRAIETARRSGVGPVELWCAPDAQHAFFAACAREHRVALRVQSGRDLGERMRRAFEAAFAEGSALVLIGSDAPALTPADLAAAAAELATHDVALTPAEDGGYVLVAMARPCAGLFEGVAWGTGGVMAHTRERLAAAGARWRELPVRWDVDRPEDYERLLRERLLPEVVS